VKAGRVTREARDGTGCGTAPAPSPALCWRWVARRTLGAPRPQAGIVHQNVELLTVRRGTGLPVPRSTRHLIGRSAGSARQSAEPSVKEELSKRWTDAARRRPPSPPVF